ncbi:MAG: leucyl/phenylalanyl-tRNA--protein transferase [Agrobacterium sp.]|nr:leucyl/phenylalanyl-tRNA--protein transferase [Agrobacterium sp.]
MVVSQPRTLLFPDEIIVRRSLAKVLRNGGFRITMDQCFSQVIAQCAQLRADEGTWILPDMQSAYHQLHQLGMAHSVEVWLDGVLVGGLYGVALGRGIFGESMFSTVGNASKVALVYLCRQLSLWEFAFIDCQFSTDHLRSMGGRLNVHARIFDAIINRCDPCRTYWTLDNSSRLILLF